MKFHLLCLMMIAFVPALLSAQALIDAPLPASPGVAPTSNSSALVYSQPSARTDFHNFLYDSFGPYPLTMALLTAGVHQATDNPPDWHQGMAGFGDRFGSNMGITLVDNATRYGLGTLLKEDTSYYRCRCTGFLPRLKHAALSTLVARKGSDGHAVFSVPVLAAPYVATTTAVYGWYPSRYGIEDALRMGNYNLLGYVASNLTIEFMPRRAGSMLGNLHLYSRRASSDDQQ